MMSYNYAYKNHLFITQILALPNSQWWISFCS